MSTRLLSSVSIRRSAQLGVDAVLVALAYWLAYQLRFDAGVPERYTDLFTNTVALVVVAKLLLFAAFGLYHKLWRFVDQRDFESIVKAAVVASLVLVGGLFLGSPLLTDADTDPPRGVVAFDFLLTLAFLVGSRFVVRALAEGRFRGPAPRKGAREVLIVGAGNGGQAVAGEMRRNPDLGDVAIGFVDDDPRKRGMRISGLKVYGSTDDLPRVLDDAEPDEVMIAIPSAPGILRQKVVTACRERGIPVRTLPTVFELLSGGVNLIRQVREVRVEDVLGREPVRAELDRVGAYLSGRVVLVTGAGGSIGSELCRQIARVGPAKLVLVENSEGALFEIRRELEDDRHFRQDVAVLADCKDAVRMREVFAEHRPHVVFHAAAYKHVPLMEENPVEAVRNNAVGTRLVAAAAGESGAERFVLVSTDKAVTPATAMGASKALAEWAVEAAQHRHPNTRFATVRFGNVLGSSGSVVPIFRRQIAAGGPVTVTDEKMTRYFMTIPEAVQLIIRSGDLGSGGEVYVLEMGDPVKIIDLARNMIRLSGHEPDVDIAIEVVGRRPGEKLHEELFNPDERPQPTPAERIVTARRDPLDPDWVETAFLRVEELVYNGDAASLARIVADLAEERAAAAKPIA
ncbi:MAG TPA: nucleoside-diphosphate sugar epimerase/dehydratase [Thermoleophilaceae bacterium]|nr:nucleoside-diphosphate sugar epimerase/dehydratase [Thermoleophilaceae bacterium]